MSVKSFLKKAQQIRDELDAPKPKHEKKAHGGGDDEAIWLTSYADLMTLLCAFFIMMMSMATFNAPKVEKVKKEVAEHFGGEYESPAQETSRFITQLIQELGIEKEVVIDSEPTGVSLVFHSTIFFDTLSSAIRDPGRAVLDKLVTGLKSRQDKQTLPYRVVVEGHTDSRPILSGNYPTNWELSSARATRVVRMFAERGFDPDKLLAIGYGDTRPRYPNRTDSGEWDLENLPKNRRVVIRILEPEVDTIPWNSKQATEEKREPAGTKSVSTQPAPQAETAAPAQKAPENTAH